MKRRKAIEIISAGVLAAAIIPSCNISSAPAFTNFDIKRSQYDFVGQISGIILPIPEEMKLENASPHQFVLTMIDDCRSPEDINKFLSGLDQIQEKLKVDGVQKDQLDSDQIKFLMQDESEETEPMVFFLNNLKRYNLQYYQSLSEYLNSYTDFEFIPGRFTGCVNV